MQVAARHEGRLSIGHCCGTVRLVVARTRLIDITEAFVYSPKDELSVLIPNLPYVHSKVLRGSEPSEPLKEHVNEHFVNI